MKTKFKLGDRVKLTKDFEDNVCSFLKGNKGVIKEIIMHGKVVDFYSIQFDNEFPGGHTGNNHKGKMGHCWNVGGEGLVKCKPKIPHNTVRKLII